MATYNEDQLINENIHNLTIEMSCDIADKITRAEIINPCRKLSDGTIIYTNEAQTIFEAYYDEYMTKLSRFIMTIKEK